MKHRRLLSNQIYPIPFDEGDAQNSSYIIYAPLKGAVYAVSGSQVECLERDLFECEDEDLKRIGEDLKNREQKTLLSTNSVDDLQNLMLLPNNVCNFKCSYCYAADGRNNKVIEFDKLKAGLDYFFDPQRAVGKKLSISVLGGGEPLLSWDLVKSALEYAIQLNKKRNTDLPISIVTNGSLLTDDMIDFYKANKISVSVTFEILEDIQKLQRGNYKKVVDNINALTDQGLDIALNAVITKNNVHLMPQMISEARWSIPKVKRMAFNPIMDSSYFSSIEESMKFYQDYISGFFDARELAKENDMYLTCTFLNAFYCVTDRYCPGKFVITAEGAVSICYFVSSSKDKLYDSFIYGKIGEDRTVSIDESKFENIISDNVKQRKECTECYARWHCGGGCFVNNQLFTDDNKMVYCQTMRSFLKKILLEKVRNGINEF